MRWLTALVPTLVSAVLYGLCFPTASLRGLAWVALVPFLAVLRHVGLGGALFLGWLWTIVMAGVMGDWFPFTVSRYFDQPAAVGIGFFVGTASLMAAGEYMAFAAYYRVLVRRPGTTVPLLAAAGWVAAELGRGWLVTGNPLAQIGYSQVGVGPLPQVADVTGVYGISFVVVAVNAALAELWWAWRRGTARRTALVGLGLAAGSVALVLGYGIVRGRTLAADDAGRPVRVALVQGNCDLGSLWRPEFYGRNLDIYTRLTRTALAEHDPDLIVWPESAMSFFFETEPSFRRSIAELLAGGHAQLLAGGPRQDGVGQRVYYNTMFLVGADGVVRGAYDKQHLLPFAEYFPAGRIDFLRRRFARVREFTPGEPTTPLPTVAGAAGIATCNEAMFPEVVRTRVREGADLLVNPANDTWLSPKFSAQLFDMVTLRAIEQRRWLIRVSTSGPSAIIDPRGVATVKTTPLTQAVVAGTLRPVRTRTIYARVGDLFAIVCTVVALVTWVRRPSA